MRMVLLFFGSRAIRMGDTGGIRIFLINRDKEEISWQQKTFPIRQPLSKWYDKIYHPCRAAMSFHFS
jgi:hypothetical protein